MCGKFHQSSEEKRTQLCLVTGAWEGAHLDKQLAGNGHFLGPYLSRVRNNLGDGGEVGRLAQDLEFGKQEVLLNSNHARSKYIRVQIVLREMNPVGRDVWEAAHFDKQLAGERYFLGHQCARNGVAMGREGRNGDMYVWGARQFEKVGCQWLGGGGTFDFGHLFHAPAIRVGGWHGITENRRKPKGKTENGNSVFFPAENNRMSTSFGEKLVTL